MTEVRYNPWQQWPLQTAAAQAPYLIGMLLDAPLIGVLKRWPHRLHAVDADAIVATRTGTFESACGVRGLRLQGVIIDGRRIAVPWPPRVKGMPDQLERCRECWEATGRKRPRADWKPQVGVADEARE